MNLETELLNPEYTNLSPRDTADLINSKTIPVPAEKRIGYGAVLEALGPDAGGVFLNTMEALAPTTPAIKWAMKLLENDNLNAGSSSVRAQLDQLCLAGVITTEHCSKLKALGEVQKPYREILGFQREIDPQDILKVRE